MGHPAPQKYATISIVPSEVPIVLCSTCNTTTNTVLRTPYGFLCPSCYKALFIPSKQPSTQLSQTIIPITQKVKVA